MNRSINLLPDSWQRAAAKQMAARARRTARNAENFSRGQPPRCACGGDMVWGLHLSRWGWCYCSDTCRETDTWYACRYVHGILQEVAP